MSVLFLFLLQSVDKIRSKMENNQNECNFCLYNISLFLILKTLKLGENI
jgi:hypothetical protein